MNSRQFFKLKVHLMVDIKSKNVPFLFNANYMLNLIFIFSCLQISTVVVTSKLNNIYSTHNLFLKYSRRVHQNIWHCCTNWRLALLQKRRSCHTYCIEANLFPSVLRNLSNGKILIRLPFIRVSDMYDLRFFGSMIVSKDYIVLYIILY